MNICANNAIKSLKNLFLTQNSPSALTAARRIHKKLCPVAHGIQKALEAKNTLRLPGAAAAPDALAETAQAVDIKKEYRRLLHATRFTK